MTTASRFGLACLCAGVVALSAFASDVPDIPATPSSITKIISAQPFVLNAGYATDWQAEHPVVTSGYLVVLDVDPDMVYPHQIECPVLYVGKQVAERINIGYDSGKVIAIVPSPVDAQGHLTLDLAASMMWFGTPALPEQVDAQDIQDEHALAQAVGITPLPKGQVAQALTRGGAMITLADKSALLTHSAPLIDQYAPTERSLSDVLSGRIGK